MEENKNKEQEVQNEELVAEEVHYKELSPARVVMRRFFRSRLSLIGVIMLVALFVFAFAFLSIIYICFIEPAFRIRRY